jgi:hypothetical protein
MRVVFKSVADAIDRSTEYDIYKQMPPSADEEAANRFTFRVYFDRELTEGEQEDLTGRFFQFYANRFAIEPPKAGGGV